MWQWVCGVSCEASAFLCERTCRNPPKKSGVKPAPYKEIPTLIGRPDLIVSRIEKCVERFKMVRTARGRKKGWRKTTPKQDAQMVSAFHRARKPLGSLCEARDVWKDCPGVYAIRSTALHLLCRLIQCAQAESALLTRRRSHTYRPHAFFCCEGQRHTLCHAYD